MELLIKGGTVVTASGSFEADVAVDGGKNRGDWEKPSGDSKSGGGRVRQTCSARALDAHTHMAMPFGGTVSADSYLSGTRAAVCGGVTTIFDYPVQHKGETILGLVNSKKEILERDACCDYAFHCCITDLNGGEILDEMAQAVEEGITSFKCFLVYKKEGMMVDDGTLTRLLLRARELGALINVHAENPDLIDLRTEMYLKEGKTSAWYHYMSRRSLWRRKPTNGWFTGRAIWNPVYLVHMADKEGLEACIRAKKKVIPFMWRLARSILNLPAMYIKDRTAGISYVRRQ